MKREVKKGIPRFDFNEGFFPQLGAMISGAKEFPLDEATAIYCCLLSAAYWDIDEEIVYVDMAELELRFCEKDAEEMANVLVQKKWATYQDDFLVLAKIQNGRIVFPFAGKTVTMKNVGKTPVKVASANSSNKMTNRFKVEPKGWFNDPEFDELREWVEERQKTWSAYLITRKKQSLADSTYTNIRMCLATAYDKKLTNQKFLDYFYGLCAMYFEWTEAPSRPPAKEYQAATTLVKNTDHWALVQIVPFWLENCDKIKKGLTGDSVTSFGYFYNQILTLKSKSGSKPSSTTNPARKYGTVVERPAK